MVDFVRIHIRGGRGGDGIISFRRERFIPKGGPDGGDGGRGGSVYVEVDRDLSNLSDFAHNKKFYAENGKSGAGDKMYGRSGEDLVIKVPEGTVIKLCTQTGEEVRTVDCIGDMRFLVAKGGKGGRGNVKFKSSTNTTPRYAEDGTMGEGFVATLELKVLADVALIGLPNVGKSTMLSVMTAARPKIADYEFTTLEPNLGVMEWKERRVVIADIPGLVEGASEGKGLGLSFLRHIQRCKVLVHVLALDAGDGTVSEDEVAERLVSEYGTVREELKKYGNRVTRKKEIVVVSRVDMVDEEKSKEIVQKVAEKTGKKVKMVSGATGVGVEELKNEMLVKVR